MKAFLVSLPVAVALAVTVVAQSAPTANAPAAPYIVQPGVQDAYRNGNATFWAKVFCGDWKAIVEFTAGTGGKRYHTRTVYACESVRSTTVRFSITRAQYATWPNGNYEFRIKVGRHDANGRVTRWTDSDSGSFRIS